MALTSTLHRARLTHAEILPPFKQECKTLDIQFHLLHGSAGQVLPGFVSDRNLGAVVTDFSPLREPQRCLEDVKKKLSTDIPLIQVKKKPQSPFNQSPRFVFIHPDTD